MSTPYGKGISFGARLHFPELGLNGKCGKRVNPRGKDRTVEKWRTVCGQSRDGDRHLHYACTVDPDCGTKSWSLEGRANHERLEHR